MKKIFIVFLLLISGWVNAQMFNDLFDAKVQYPKFKNSSGPKILIDNAHHNFIVEMGLIKPLVEVLEADGYSVTIDSGVFTKDYLSKFDIVAITPALPFKFGTKNEVTDEITFSSEELNSIHNWVLQGGAILILSEHAPIDKAMTPLLNKFGIKSSIGAVIDSVHCDTSIKLPNFTTYLQFNKKNGLLQSNHPIIKGTKHSEQISNLITYTGCSLYGEGYTNLLKLSPTAYMRKWNGSLPSSLGNSQCLANCYGKGKVLALGDCNGFTAMYVNNKNGDKLPAGMQVANYDWKQFVLNSFHWLSN